MSARPRLREWSRLAGHPSAILVFGVLIVAISGLPPFPGFWAKWQLVMTLASDERYAWIAIVLIGSLLEAAYMFRWFGQSVHGSVAIDSVPRNATALVPIYGMAALLVASGYVTATFVVSDALWTALPLAAGAAVLCLWRLPARVQGVIALAIVLVGGLWMVRDLSGLNQLFAVVLLAGGLVVAIGCLYRSDARPGFYPLLAVMLLSLPALPRATTSLEFFFVWELITLSSYFLVLLRREAMRVRAPLSAVLAGRRVLPAGWICCDARSERAVCRCRHSVRQGPMPCRPLSCLRSDC